MRAFGNRLALTHLPAMVATYNQGTRASELVRQYAPPNRWKEYSHYGCLSRKPGRKLCKASRRGTACYVHPR